MNITMSVEPPETGNCKLPTYGELVMLAESVFRDAMLANSKMFAMTHANVMAWSDTHHRSLDAPYRYRVTADFDRLRERSDAEE